MDSRPVGATETLRQWEAFRARSPAARLVCLDLQPYADSQAVSRADILNIGGFSDAVFEVLGRFARGEHNAEHWGHRGGGGVGLDQDSGHLVSPGA